MTRIMRDSTTLTDIPTRGVDIIAAYRNGSFTVTLADIRIRFPHQAVAWIDVNGTHPADAGILDVETGDATPAQSPIWVKARRTLHPNAYPPIIYCNRSTLTPVFNAMNSAGLRVVRDFRLWPATLDGTNHLADMTGVTAIQARGQAQTGGHYDESDVFDSSWLAPAPPAPAPAPSPVIEVVTDGTLSLHDLAAAHHTGPSTILRLTAAHAGQFDAAVANWLNSVVFSPSNTTPIPAGLKLWTH